MSRVTKTITYLGLLVAVSVSIHCDSGAANIEQEDLRTTDESLSDGAAVELLSSMQRAEVMQLEAAIGRFSDDALDTYAVDALETTNQMTLELEALADGVGAIPVETERSEAFDAAADKASDALEAAPSGLVDRAFLDLQAAHYAAVIDAIDEEVLPSTDDADLLEWAQGAREVAEEQLELVTELAN